jgi:hypothetical protein
VSVFTSCFVLYWGRIWCASRFSADCSGERVAFPQGRGCARDRDTGLNSYSASSGRENSAGQGNRAFHCGLPGICPPGMFHRGLAESPSPKEKQVS